MKQVCYFDIPKLIHLPSKSQFILKYSVYELKLQQIYLQSRHVKDNIFPRVTCSCASRSVIRIAFGSRKDNVVLVGYMCVR
jgi:hypothetical protein